VKQTARQPVDVEAVVDHGSQRVVADQIAIPTATSLPPSLSLGLGINLTPLPIHVTVF
jgi:hypothetical protein